MESPDSSSVKPNGSQKDVIPTPTSHATMRQRLAEITHELGLFPGPEELSDFTVTPRVLLLSLLAILVGGLGAGAAWILRTMIFIITNAVYYGRWSTSNAQPTLSHVGDFVILIVVGGAAVAGLMARYGTEQIRGDGLPEGIQSILFRGSKVLPKVAFWKPLSAAIVIGTGSPFGPEGPIITTGGALGSIVAQFFKMSSAERKTLLVAGGAAGLTAAFGTPVAGVLMAIEVFLFEFKPRSLIPVAISCATAGLLRYYIIGFAPLFPVPVHADYPGGTGLISCVLVGLVAGLGAIILTVAIDIFEDGFGKIPVHWMWWPAIASILVGIGGVIEPRALGMGYDQIAFMLNGNLALKTMIGLLIVKAIIWTASLSSNIPGGVIAPVLIIGCCLGGIEAQFLPHLGVGYWALISMAAIMAGIYRAPLMSIVFALELTHDSNMLLPLLLACYVAYALPVLVMKRSILTEKIVRQGYHVTFESSVDPLEILMVREAMRTHIEVIPTKTPLSDLENFFRVDPQRRRQGLYPVVDEEKKMIGIVTRSTIFSLGSDHVPRDTQVDSLAESSPVVAHPEELLSTVVYRMARTGFTRMPVVPLDDPRKLLGIISLDSVLQARLRNLESERRRERVLDPHMVFSFWPHTPNPPEPPPPSAAETDKTISRN